jgi:adenylosuccinate lyase
LAILPIDSGRYGTKEMLIIFSEQKKVDYQLEIEGAAAISQSEIGMISKSVGKEIFKIAMSGKILAKRIKQLEVKSDHDTAALVESLSEKCSKNARPWIHYGLTSNDLVDTSNSMQMRDALQIIEPKVAKMASILAKKAIKYEKIPAVGRTHGQHASIISFGLKFANWAAEMAKHVERIEEIKKRILICKTLGVVGTGSLMGAKSLEVQKRVAKRLKLFPAEVTTQVIPRERYTEYVFELALIGATLEEQFKKGQMGSSAVPVKRNPIKSERVSSLSKLVRSQVAVSFENIPLWHERDLSNSANERFVIPTVSILVDEMLETMTRIVSNLMVNEKRIVDNLYITKGQIFAEFVLEALIKKGIPRFVAYKDVQRVAFEANDKGMQYIDALKKDKAFSSKLTDKEIDSIFSPEKHLGASSAIIKNVEKSVQNTIRKFI